MIRVLIIAAALSVAVSAQTGSYSLYGNGCAGSGTGSGPSCGGLNTMGGTGHGGGNDNVFALEVAPSSSARAVIGAEFFTRLKSGTTPVMVKIALHMPDSAGMPQPTAARTGMVTVNSTTAGWAKGTFNSPMAIAANTKFFVVYGDIPAGRTTHPIIMDPTGIRGTYYWHPPTIAAWRGPFTSQRWAFRVTCGGGSGGAVPLMANTGVPTLNQSFSLDLSQAAKNSQALFAFGASRTMWATVNLPLDVSPFGAPNCSLLASIDLIIPMGTSPAGAASLTVQVPNAPFLVGRTFYNQALVVDRVNSLGLVFSNGGAGTVGR